MGQRWIYFLVFYKHYVPMGQGRIYFLVFYKHYVPTGQGSDSALCRLSFFELPL